MLDDFIVEVILQGIGSIEEDKVELPEKVSVVLNIIKTELEEAKKKEQKAETDDEQYWHQSYYKRGKDFVEPKQLTTREDMPPSAWEGDFSEM